MKISLSVDQKRGELIKQAFEKGGFKVRNSPLQGDSYRLYVETMKSDEGETMEIYKKRIPILLFLLVLYILQKNITKNIEI